MFTLVKVQTDSNQREVGKRDNGGTQGRGHKGTCIKDTWTKPKGVGSRVAGRDG